MEHGKACCANNVEEEEGTPTGETSKRVPTRVGPEGEAQLPTKDRVNRTKDEDANSDDEYEGPGNVDGSATQKLTKEEAEAAKKIEKTRRKNAKVKLRKQEEAAGPSVVKKEGTVYCRNCNTNKCK